MIELKQTHNTCVCLPYITVGMYYCTIREVCGLLSCFHLFLSLFSAFSFVESHTHHIWAYSSSTNIRDPQSFSMFKYEHLILALLSLARAQKIVSIWQHFSNLPPFRIKSRGRFAPASKMHVRTRIEHLPGQIEHLTFG